MTTGSAADELRLYWRPERQIGAIVFLTAVCAMFVASAAGVLGGPLPGWVYYPFALWTARYPLGYGYYLLFKRNQPAVVASQEGLLCPRYSASVIPWEKVLAIRRRYYGTRVLGVWLRIDPVFDGTMKRNWVQRLSYRVNAMFGFRGSLQIGTTFFDPGDRALYDYCEAMMHPKEARNV